VRHACYTPGHGFCLEIYTLILGLARFLQFGEQTFVLPPTMQSLLTKTSLEGVKFSEVGWPYPSFYVALPESGLRLWSQAEVKDQELTGVLVQVNPDFVGLYLWAAGVESGKDAAFWISFSAEQIGEDDLETYIRGLLKNPDNLLSNGPRPGTDQSPLSDEIIEGTMRAIRIIFNAALYVSSPGAEQTKDPVCAERVQQAAVVDRFKNPNKKQARQARKKLDAMPRGNIVWLGRSVKIHEPREPRSEADQPAGSARPARPHWVRGHWWPKQLAEGSAHKQRRWVQPYQRNKIEGHAPAPRNYVLADDAPAPPPTPAPAP
jgi:hypothetical protein